MQYYFINNCYIVGGASNLHVLLNVSSMVSPQVFWCYLHICQRNKQSRSTRLPRFQLEQGKQLLVFFLLVAYVVGRYLCNDHGLVLTSTGLDPTLYVFLNGVCTLIPRCMPYRTLAGSLHYVLDLYSRSVLDTPRALLIPLTHLAIYCRLIYLVYVP